MTAPSHTILLVLGIDQNLLEKRTITGEIYKFTDPRWGDLFIQMLPVVTP